MYSQEMMLFTILSALLLVNLVGPYLYQRRSQRVRLRG